MRTGIDASLEWGNAQLVQVIWTGHHLLEAHCLFSYNPVLAEMSLWELTVTILGLSPISEEQGPLLLLLLLIRFQIGRSKDGGGNVGVCAGPAPCTTAVGVHSHFLRVLCIRCAAKLSSQSPLCGSETDLYIIQWLEQNKTCSESHKQHFNSTDSHSVAPCSCLAPGALMIWWQGRW